MSSEPAIAGSNRAPRADGWAWLLALGLLAAATFASYRPVLNAGFVNYDDTAYVQHNEHVNGGLELEEVRWALTGYESSNWHPLTWISHMVDVELFGFAPRGPHAVNLVLHLLNVALLFAVLRALSGDPLPSLAVAAFFALHPANVESVAWIAQRKTLLCTLFMLLSIGAYAAWTRGGGLRRYLASLGLFGLAMASKPMIVTFPFALLLLDYWPLRRAAFAEGPDGRVALASLVRGFLRLVPEKLPFLALSGLLALITLDAQQAAMSPLDKYSVWDRLSNVAISYVGYLGTFAWPDRLAVFYPLYPERQRAAAVAACAALVAALTAGAVLLGLRRRHLLFGWLWYLGTLVPVIGLVQVGMQSMADRYVYVPFWGLACAVAWSVQEGLRTRPLALPARAAAAALALAVLAVLGTLTFRQSGAWKDGLTLFSSALANTADNYLAHSVLAERFFADEEFERSIDHSIEAAKSRRNMGAVRSTYGLALYNLGRRAEALEQFKLAAAQEPDNPLGYMNLGWFEAERGRYDQALVDLATAAGRISEKTLPYTKRTTYANWANALAKTGQLEQAREKYELALEVDDEDVAVLRDAARVDLQLREPDRATARLRRVLELAPDDADAPWLLACAAQLAGADAAPLFARARDRAPRQALVAIELARTLGRQARFDEAVALVETVLALELSDPDDARFVSSTARAHLGEMRLAAGDVAGAMAELERALALDPASFDANNRLAFLLATNVDPALRDPARAMTLAERAVAERREAASLATLATAQAAAGRMPTAIETARAGLALATEASDANSVAALERQLAVFAGMQASAKRTPRP